MRDGRLLWFDDLDVMSERVAFIAGCAIWVFSDTCLYRRIEYKTIILKL